MVGPAFDAALREAQQGRPEGFLALFRGHQPALHRTLRGLAPELADRVSAATWRQVVRDLDSFTGDEYGFRVWLITLGRIQLRACHATGDHQGATPAREVRHLRFVGPIPVARRSRTTSSRPSPDPVQPPPGRGAPVRWTWPITTDEALSRVRDLPPDQAEAVLLRVVASLQPLTVADRLHLGSADARTRYQNGLRSASRARHGSSAAPHHGTTPHPPLLGPSSARIEAMLDDLGFEPRGPGEKRMAELVALLRAPTTPADLVGEQEALAAFTHTEGGRGLARVRRRTVAIAVVSAATTVMTITTAAAATGTLPEGLQQLAHTYVGAPAPAPVVAPSPALTAPTPPVPPRARAAAVRTVAAVHETTSDRAARPHTPDAARTSAAGPATGDPVSTAPLADPTPATTPAPSAAPSITDPPDATGSPTATPSGSASDSPTDSTSPSATVSGTPSASAPSEVGGAASPASTDGDAAPGPTVTQDPAGAPPALP